MLDWKYNLDVMNAHIYLNKIHYMFEKIVNIKLLTSLKFNHNNKCKENF